MMKFNWKILVALVVLVSGFVWGVESLRVRTYSGTDVDFGVGSGPVTVTNPSEDAVSVQLVGTGIRTFSITNGSNDLSGTSERQGNGRSATQLLELELPTGVSEFSILRGQNVTFVATTDEPLEISLQSLNAEDAQSTLIGAVVIMFGAISYIGYTTRRRWINKLPGETFNIRDTEPIKAVDPHGSDIRPYGDNRSSTKV